jgi:hypothetical protein
LIASAEPTEVPPNFITSVPFEDDFLSAIVCLLVQDLPVPVGNYAFCTLRALYRAKKRNIVL